MMQNIKNTMFIDKIGNEAIVENNNEGLKVIFLDIDGVIQPYNNSFRFKHSMDETAKYLAEKYDDKTYLEIDKYDLSAAFYDWDESAIGHLKKILYLTDARIVIHSDWRKYNSLEKIKCMFKLYDMDNYIIDLTNTEKEKVESIEQYLDENKNITNYVIIDDLDMSKIFGANFVLTSDFIKEEDTKAIYRLLNGKYTLEKEEKLTLKINEEPVVNIKEKDVEIKDVNIKYYKFYFHRRNEKKYENLQILLNAVRKYTFETQKDTPGFLVSFDEYDEEAKKIMKNYGVIKHIKEDEKYLVYYSLKNGWGQFDIFFDNVDEIIKEIKK